MSKQRDFNSEEAEGYKKFINSHFDSASDSIAVVRRADCRPTCPRCNHTMTDDEMLDSNNDLFGIALQEEMEEVVCPACDRNFFCRGTYTPQYSSATSEELLD